MSKLRFDAKIDRPEMFRLKAHRFFLCHVAANCCMQTLTIVFVCVL